MATRDEVYNSIDTERDYQDTLINNPGQEDMHVLTMGDAHSTWYNESAPYSDTMPLIRKIAGVCVQAMEEYGAPERKIPTGLVDRKAR